MADMEAICCPELIEAGEVKELVGLGWLCIDVRSATEFAAGHIPGANNIPMDEIESRVDDLPPNTILVCQAGKRAEMTRSMLAGQLGELAVLRGGTDAWKAGGLPLVVSTRTRWALERQVRLGAGILVLTGVVLGLLISPLWFGLAGFVGAGLVVAGTTNFCGMAYLLALLPWNRRGSRIEGSTCGANRRV